MFSLIGYGLLGLVVSVGVVTLLVLILPNDHLGLAPRDVVPSGLPARPEIRGTDVARVRLPVTVRGYRMVDTDAVLDRLAFELERRDQEIDELRQRAGLPRSGSPASPEVGGPHDRDEVLAPAGSVPASGDTDVATGSFTSLDPSHPLSGVGESRVPESADDGSTRPFDGSTRPPIGAPGAAPNDQRTS